SPSQRNRPRRSRTSRCPWRRRSVRNASSTTAFLVRLPVSAMARDSSSSSKSMFVRIVPPYTEVQALSVYRRRHSPSGQERRSSERENIQERAWGVYFLREDAQNRGAHPR